MPTKALAIEKMLLANLWGVIPEIRIIVGASLVDAHHHQCGYPSPGTAGTRPASTGVTMGDFPDVRD